MRRSPAGQQAYPKTSCFRTLGVVFGTPCTVTGMQGTMARITAWQPHVCSKCQPNTLLIKVQSHFAC